MHPIQQHIRWWIGAALLPFAFVMALRWGDPPSATDGDYAQYLLHAKALAEGRAYSDIGYIHTELNLVGPRNQPPGWPLVLAPIVGLFGVHSPLIRLLVIALVSGFAVTTGLYFVKRGENLAGIAVTAAVPLALESQRATGSALSDPLFCLVVWLALLLTDYATTRRRELGALALAGVAVTVRIAGVAMGPAFLLHAVLRKRPAIWRLTALLPAAIIAVGIVIVLGAPYIPILEGVAENLTRERHRAALVSTYRLTLSAGALYPFPGNLANDIYHAIVAIPMLVGAIRFARRDAGSAVWCFTLAYGALLVLSPLKEPRYAWPLMPLVMMWIVTGSVWLASRFLPAVRLLASRRVIAGAVGAVALGAAVQLVLRPVPESLLHDPDTMELFAWVRETLQKGDTVRVVFSNPRVLTLETDASAMGIPEGSESAVLAELVAKHISYVVLPVHATYGSERRLIAIVNRNPLRFPGVLHNGKYDVRRFLAGDDSTRMTGAPGPAPAQ